MTSLAQDLDLLRPDWWDEAACADADPDLFFVEKGKSTKPARAICAQCPVREECRDWAVEMRLGFGIFGGMSVRQRQRYAKAAGVRSRHEQLAAARRVEAIELVAAGTSLWRASRTVGVPIDRLRQDVAAYEAEHGVTLIHTRREPPADVDWEVRAEDWLLASSGGRIGVTKALAHHWRVATSAVTGRIRHRLLELKLVERVDGAWVAGPALIEARDRRPDLAATIPPPARHVEPTPRYNYRPKPAEPPAEGRRIPAEQRARDVLDAQGFYLGDTYRALADRWGTTRGGARAATSRLVAARLLNRVGERFAAGPRLLA